jgi:hypothetical protein
MKMAFIYYYFAFSSALPPSLPIFNTRERERERVGLGHASPIMLNKSPPSIKVILLYWDWDWGWRLLTSKQNRGKRERGRR